MSGYVPLLGALAFLIVVVIRGDLLTTIVGVLVVAVLMAASAIVFAINGNRNGRGRP